MNHSQYLELSKALPKTELHLHLDGSLPEEFLKQRLKARGVQVPDNVGMRDFLHTMKEGQGATAVGYKQERNGNWKVFDYCNQVLQTKEELSGAMVALFRELEAHRVFYAEVRFCPGLHVLEGLTEDQVVLSVVQGLEEALATTTVQGGGIIIGALRSKISLVASSPSGGDKPAEEKVPEESHSLRMVKLAHKYKDRGVVGFDVCGDEGNFKLSLHKEALDFAVREGIRLAVHAGEWTHTHYDGEGGSLSNIELLLDCGVRRIGHGIVLKEDPVLMSRAVEKGVAVECCLTANVCGRRVKSYADHPIKEMLEAGVKVTLNSDNMTLSGNHQRICNPTNEVFVAMSEVGLTLGQIKTVLMNGAEAGFAMTPALIEKFRLQLDQALAHF